MSPGRVNLKHFCSLSAIKCFIELLTSWEVQITIDILSDIMGWVTFHFRAKSAVGLMRTNSPKQLEVTLPRCVRPKNLLDKMSILYLICTYRFPLFHMIESTGTLLSLYCTKEKYCILTFPPNFCIAYILIEWISPWKRNIKFSN